MQFVVVDLDRQRSAEQEQLVKKYYQGSIPHVVILDAHGSAVYNKAGEMGEAAISHILDGLLNGQGK